jgi:DNA replication protein DnaC
LNSPGSAPLSRTGAESLFEIFNPRHEHGSTIVASSLPLEEWTSVSGDHQLSGALLDRITPRFVERTYTKNGLYQDDSIGR